MDKEVLEILKRLEQNVNSINTKVDRLEVAQEEIMKKIDITCEQVVRTAEDVTDIKKDLVFVEEAPLRIGMI